MKLSATLLILAAAATLPVVGQVFDNSGNGMLNGEYYFREVTFTSTDYIALYGNITFTSGTYAVTGTQGLDCNQSGCSGPSSYSTNGTYSISASGYGFISNQLLNSPIYGSVGANGVFVGSVTENGNWDLFIAAPVMNQSTSTLQGSYTLAYIDLTNEIVQVPIDAQLQMSPNGSGGIGNVNVSAYATSSTPATQTISGVKYFVSNNAFVIQFPSSSTSSNLIQGNEYLYSTPDGSFVFGGSPLDFDMIVGVKTGGSTPNFGGLYYQAGMDYDNSSNNFDTYYGTIAASSGVIIGHQRFQYGGGPAQDSTYSDSYTQGSNNYTDNGTGTQYFLGSGGVRIGLGLGPLIGINVAVPAPSLSGSGVYLNPAGVVNSASFAPFTAGISRGEFITLLGTNIGPSSAQAASTLPLPTKLGGVQVLINNVAAPLNYVSANQINAIVPWELTSSVAQIQVVNNGSASNVVTEFVSTTTPGVFTTSSGIGYAIAQHSSNFSLVSPSNPAQIGETVVVYVTGLGDVSPGVADGVPASGVSNTTNTIIALVGGVSAPVTFSGLTPGFPGLYQVNIQIPTGVSAGDNALAIGNNDGSSYTVESLISIGSGTASSATPTPQIRPLPPANARHLPKIK